MTWFDNFESDLKAYIADTHGREIPDDHRLVDLSTHEETGKCGEGTCDYEWEGLTLYFMTPGDRWTARGYEVILEDTFSHFLKWVSKNEQS